MKLQQDSTQAPTGTAPATLKDKAIPPGSTIGVFGGGQLGRMFTHAAQRLGYHVVVFTNEVDSPASQSANETIIGEYRDPMAVRNFAERVDVITLEFENIPIDAVARASDIVPVRPGLRALSTAQHRIREKSTLLEAGFPVTPFREISSVEQISPAAEALGWPMIFKTTCWGYDGKGQRKVATATEASDAFELLGPEPLIAEKLIPYVAEVSVLVARSPRGEIATYPMFHNSHSNHILDVTVCPAGESLLAIEPEAQKIAQGIAETLQLEGLMCVEFFITDAGQLLINEIAPRPHNSGHLTIEGCRTSQFEQQVRAVCNLPLGDTSLIQPAAMVNLLGDVWEDGLPYFERALSQSASYLHLYGKREPRLGRKMGHLTVLADSPEAASLRATELRAELRGKSGRLF